MRPCQSHRLVSAESASGCPHCMMKFGSSHRPTGQPACCRSTKQDTMGGWMGGQDGGVGGALLDTLQQTGGVIFDRHSSTTMSSACQQLAMSLNDFFTGHTK